MVRRSPISIPLRFTAEGGGSFRVALRQLHSKELRKREVNVRILARNLDGSKPAQEGVEVVRGDLLDPIRRARRSRRVGIWGRSLKDGGD